MSKIVAIGREWADLAGRIGRLFAQGDLNLYLVRHGETQGNVNRALYKKIADHAIRLTERGILQAGAAGEFLAERLYAEYKDSPRRFGSVRVWFSPYYRTRQTACEIIHALGQKFGNAAERIAYREDPFLTEQKAGLFDGLTDEQFKELHPKEAENYERHKNFLGRIYGKAPLGETRLEVAIRVKHHFRTVLEDYTSRNIRHVIIVSHGVTVRAYEMGWMRYAPEWLDSEKNPGNCWIRYIHGRRAKGYTDEGYIHGEDAPFNDPGATQRLTDGAEQVFMLKPQRPNTIVSPGITVIDPFQQRCGK